MKYLLKLHRFDMDLKSLEKKLNSKILEQIKDRIVVDTDVKNLSDLPEIKEIIDLKLNWTKFENFNNFLDKSSKIIQSKNYNPIVKFLEKNRYSAGEIKKKLNSYLMNEGKNYNLDGDLIYIEFKGKTDLYFRIGIMEKKSEKNLNMNFNFTVIVENPQDIGEISDFLRVCWIFNMPLIILGKKKEIYSVLESAKRITKGIDYDKFTLNIQEKLPDNLQLIGFSKLAKKNEIDLVKILDKNKQIGLVFGNEKFGLTQQLREKLDLYHLTPSNKKPLRASQALTYFLGLSVAKAL